MIRIENKKVYKGDGFFIGRPSPLGNPFPVNIKTSRSEAIYKYRDWLTEKLQSDNPTSKSFIILAEYYRDHGELTLICFCAPLQCHGEVIRDLIYKALEESGPKE